MIIASAVAMMAAPVAVSTSASAAVRPAYTNEGTTTFQDVFNNLCLDGREGTGNVTVQVCGSDGTHQDWTWLVDASGRLFLEDDFNGLCLTNNGPDIFLESCGTYGELQEWTTPSYYVTLNANDWENMESKECLDGREGFGGVTIQVCNTDSTHQDWVT
jgi:hypothetical protein